MEFFGYTSDVREAIKQIKHIRPEAILFNIGISVGSGLLVRYFGEVGNEFDGGVGVCPGYDIEICLARMQTVYQYILLQSAKKYFLQKNKALLESCNGYNECMSATNMQDFVDNTYSMAGYASKEEYYKHTNPMRVISGIDKPLLIINAEDGKLILILLLWTTVYTN